MQMLKFFTGAYVSGAPKLCLIHALNMKGHATYWPRNIFQESAPGGHEVRPFEVPWYSSGDAQMLQSPLATNGLWTTSLGTLGAPERNPKDRFGIPCVLLGEEFFGGMGGGI